MAEDGVNGSDTNIDNDFEAITEAESGKQDLGNDNSRRDFIRKSAEIAAFTLFGLASLDSLFASTLKRLSEIRSIGKIGANSAEEIQRLGITSSANGTVSPLFACAPGWVCTTGYSCSPSLVTCENHLCTLDPYGCTRDRSFECTEDFTCYLHFNCLLNQNYQCTAKANCQLPTQYHNMNC